MSRCIAAPTAIAIVVAIGLVGACAAIAGVTAANLRPSMIFKPALPRLGRFEPRRRRDSILNRADRDPIYCGQPEGAALPYSGVKRLTGCQGLQRQRVHLALEFGVQQLVDGAMAGNA